MALSRPSWCGTHGVGSNWLARQGVRAAASVVFAVALVGAVDVANAASRESAEAIQAESVDASEFFGKLVHRYRGLTLYQDSVRLAHRTVDGALDGVPSVQAGNAEQGDGVKPDASATERERRSEQLLGILISGTMLDVSSSSVGAGASCDTRDASPVGRLALARQIWTLPHLALRFADEPLRSMHVSEACGSLIPKRVDSVTINERQFLRLHLESERSPGAAPDERCDETTVDFFVNPTSMLVERVEQRHELGEGMRYEATLEIVPSRALEEPVAEDPAAAPGETPKEAPKDAPAIAPTAAPATMPTTPVLTPPATPNAAPAGSAAPAVAPPAAPQPPADSKRGPLAGPSVGCE